VRLAIVLLLTCGCRQIFGIDPPRLVDSGSPGDGSIDASDGATTPLCFSRPELELSACLSRTPTMAFTVVTFDTDLDTATACEPTLSASQDMCVIAGTDVTVAAAVTVTGSRPLVLFATGTIAIDGMVDVASHAMGPTRGPGENPSACGTTDGGTIGGGGAGGSFTTSGGDGGHGGPVGSTSGISAPAIAVQTFHGGCRGGLGGGGVAGGTYGGGALALVANVVAVNAVIDASGAGGAGAATGARGGYGGGTGGMVLIDAPTFNLAGTAQIFANGGGGGGGSSLSVIGNPGGEASSYNGFIQGGPGGNTGGPGGSAFPQAQVGQPSGGQNAGGGGGGGGAGAILIYTSSTLGNNPRISPLATLHAY
jgi:hypothetical protein